MKKLPFTRKSLEQWAGKDVVRDAEILLREGNVLRADFEGNSIQGSVIAKNHEMRTGLRLLSPTLVENTCPCYTSRERGRICSHSIAVALLLIQRAADPLREEKYRNEQRRAGRLAEIDESAYMQRVPPETSGAMPARLRIRLADDWLTTIPCGFVRLHSSILLRDTEVPPEQVATDVPLAFEKTEENLLFVLEDIGEGPLKSETVVQCADFLNILALYRGKSLSCSDGSDVQVGTTPLTSYLHMDLDRETGELILFIHTEVPFLKSGQVPLYIVHGNRGWVYGEGHAWPLAEILPGPYHGIYRDVITIPRGDVLRFMQNELPALEKICRVESDLSLDLFTIDPAFPAFHLRVSGSPASLSATLYADYGMAELVAGKPDALGNFARPDPDDLLRYEVRNPKAEKEALARLNATGFTGEVGDDLASIIDKRNVMNFLGSHLPALRRLGWRVDFEGRVTDLIEKTDFVTPVVHIESTRGVGWFDVHFDFEDVDGASISAADIQRALRKGESFLDWKGRTILIDADAVDELSDVFSDCSETAGAEPGHFQVRDTYAAFVKSSLDALDGVDVEDSPEWRKRAGMANRSVALEPVTLPPELERILRPYQKTGVNWLRFIERSGMGALLADEMGLGKTVQVLAWLQLERVLPENRGKPALVVCPTSLVENWKEEAERFTPHLKVLMLRGSERHAAWETLSDVDLAITSYALLRRDADRYAESSFAAVILDEAQHIKNRKTQNAQAAKSLAAGHRVVLTGTPMENSVSDLWSIMDFLIPGYMGRHDAFRANYEQPIERADDSGELAQAKLRRKLHPFLLRRLKRDVARDLPPKIERVATSPLSPDQAAVYKMLLDQSRRKIGNLVSRQGFNRSRMEILTLLMRLRQVCCHLDLLKLPDLKARQPSSKLDQCMELLDEAIDSTHRVLIFSQFVSMLHILRDGLSARGFDYCYLDGSTRNRMQEVHRFNTERSVPVFLISLKAGGTGLNLTGADMVIHFDPWWNPAVENQATDRAYRIGQKRTVYSVKLIAADTVEEKVLALQRKKKALIDATVESDEDVVRKLTWEDVQELLEM